MYSEEWKKALDIVDEFISSSDGTAWFRGQNQASHKLNSGLFRLNIDGSLDKYLHLESQFYTYYRSLGHLLHNNESDWNLLYSMQHHGVKTRLLDWSESFAVALYFACLGWNNNSARIWMLNPIKLNSLSLGKKEIILPKNIFTYPNYYLDKKYETIPSMAIQPIKNNSRIIAQNGVFTVQGNSLKPLEDEFDKMLIKNGGLYWIDLTLNTREDAFKYLKQNGITNYSLFPDLDGLSIYLNNLLIKRSWI